MLNQGIQIKQYIEKNNSSQMIVVKDSIFYDENNDKYYEEIFNNLIEDGLILATSMDDNTWKLLSEFNYNTFCKFQFELSPKINNILKRYILVKFGVQNTTPSNISKSLKTVSNFLVETNFLNKDNIISFRDGITYWTNTKKQNSYFCKEFLRFSQLENSKEYYKILDSISIPRSKSRLLPSYQSIITFDYIINDFLKNACYENKYKFYPVVIWWQLTKILPLRPIELSLLERNSLYSSNDKFYLKIKRRKNKNGKVKYNSIPPLKNIELSSDVFQLINEYIIYSRKINNSKYLFNYEVLKQFLRSCPDSRVDTDYSGVRLINDILNKFYKDVVSKIYGYIILPKQDEGVHLKFNEIETIQLGDTRHIAICSMMLQGFNELTIAQLAGHKSISEQSSYCNHLDSYTDAYTYVMAKSFQNKINLNKSSFNIRIKSKNMILNKASIDYNFHSLRIVDNGVCTSINFPYECDIDDCLFCDYFICNIDISESIINEKLKITEKEINTKLNYIKSVISKGIKNSDYNNHKTNINSLNTMLKRKAILQAYKMNKEVNNEQ